MHASSFSTSDICCIFEYLLDTTNEGDKNIHILCANHEVYIQQPVKGATYYK